MEKIKFTEHQKFLIEFLSESEHELISYAMRSKLHCAIPDMLKVRGNFEAMDLIRETYKRGQEVAIPAMLKVSECAGKMQLIRSAYTYNVVETVEKLIDMAPKGVEAMNEYLEGYCLEKAKNETNEKSK